MKILFRTDASLDIGTGHVMRCLTLANELVTQGGECIFVIKNHLGHLADIIRQQGFQVEIITLTTNRDDKLFHSAWLGSTQIEDADLTKKIAQNFRPDLLVVDHYALDEDWEKQLRPFCQKILAIDDLADRKHDCDWLLDQNLGKTPVHYQHLVPERCALLLGPQYALLQPQYAELHRRALPRQGPIKNILVYFGGSDLHDLTGMATQAYLQLNRPDIQLNVVMGSSYSYRNKLEKFAQVHSNIKLYQNLPSLAPLMFQADLAIGAGGGTSWERCCLGLLTIIVTLEKNQISIARELHQQQMAHWLGSAENIDIQTIQQALNEALKGEQDLEAWSLRCLKITHAQGTAIVAGYMLLNKHTKLYARLANLTDEKQLFDWTNDLQTRKNSFNTAQITPEHHHQ